MKSLFEVPARVWLDGAKWFHANLDKPYWGKGSGKGTEGICAFIFYHKDINADFTTICKLVNEQLTESNIKWFTCVGGKTRNTVRMMFCLLMAEATRITMMRPSDLATWNTRSLPLINKNKSGSIEHLHEIPSYIWRTAVTWYKYAINGELNREAEVFGVCRTLYLLGVRKSYAMNIPVFGDYTDENNRKARLNYCKKKYKSAMARERRLKLKQAHK